MSISFIKNVYGDTIPPLTERDKYQSILNTIEAEGVSSQVYYLLKEKGMLGNTPSFFQEKLRKLYQQSLFLNLYIKNQQTRILENFEVNQIEVIPLKGTHFAEKYYRDLGARSTSDIDLLIKGKDLSEAIRIVKFLGFKMEEEQIKNHFHISLIKDIPGSSIPLTVELHWNLVWKRTANLNITSFWNDALPIGGNRYVKELSSFHTFYSVCLHGWRHNMDSPKYFLDIIQVAEILGDGLDLHELFTVAKLDQTLKRVVRTLSIVAYHFPNLNQFLSLPKKRRLMCYDAQPVVKDIRSNRVKKVLDFMDYQFFSFDTMIHSIREVLAWVGSGLLRRTPNK